PPTASRPPMRLAHAVTKRSDGKPRGPTSSSATERHRTSDWTMLPAVPRSCSIFLLWFALAAAGCREKVALGGWDVGAGTTDGGAAGAGTGNTGTIELPSCLQQGSPGPLNSAGEVFG